MTKTILTIDGIDGSGKSVFCRQLFEALHVGGIETVSIRVDDFRRGAEWSSAGIAEHDAYYDGYFDLAACEVVLSTFLVGASTVEVPVYDIGAERRVGSKRLALEGATVLVLEGVFPLRMPSAAAGTLIYLDTTEPEARRRILKRDLAKGRTEAEITRRMDQRYFPSQARYRSEYGPRDRAAIVIDNERLAERRGIKRDLGGLPSRLREVLAQFLPVPHQP